MRQRLSRSNSSPAPAAPGHPLLLLAAVLLLAAGACQLGSKPGDGAPDDDPDEQRPDLPWELPDGGLRLPDGGLWEDLPLPSFDGGLVAQRPYKLTVPKSYDGTAPVPLVLLLHGYGGDADNVDELFRYTALAEKRGFVLARADGLKDTARQQFWNATDGCCNFQNRNVDDVAYLSEVVLELRYRYRIDSRRIYVVGHSNGAFMAHRMACDQAPWIAAIASHAGAVWKDASRCKAAGGSPSVLQVHGTNDGTIDYQGGKKATLEPFPGAVETVTQWATRNGCTGSLTDTGERRDFVPALPGNETRRERFEGCPRGEVELWSVVGGEHRPDYSPALGEAIYDFLLAHPRVRIAN